MPPSRRSAGSCPTSATPTTSRLQTVGRFLDACDFYTIDVADFIGQPAAAADIDSFVKRHPELLGSIQLEGVDEAFEITAEDLRQTAQKYLDRREEGRRGLSHNRERQGRGQLHPRGLDGRDRHARRARSSCSSFWPPSPMKAFPCRPSLPSSAAASTRAWITSATWRSSSASLRSTSRPSLTPSSTSACRRISS